METQMNQNLAINELLSSLSQELNKVMKTLERLVQEPEKVTPDLKKSALDGVRLMVQQVKNTRESVVRGSINIARKLRIKAVENQKYPYEVIDNILQEFSENMNIEFQLSGGEVEKTALDDFELSKVVEAILNTSKNCARSINEPDQGRRVVLSQDRGEVVITYVDKNNRLPKYLAHRYFEANSDLRPYGAHPGLIGAKNRVVSAGGRIGVQVVPGASIFVVRIPVKK